MKKPFALLVALILVSSVNAQTKILFLGNSYTASNNLPNMVYELALELGDTIIFDSNTPGGHTFNGHSTNPTTLNKIASNDWDFVVLQEQSQIPSFSPAQVAVNSYPFAAILIDSIRSNNACTQPVFYMTWGRKFGDQNNCGVLPPVCTFEGMQAQLRRSYLELGDIHDATVAPAGMAWFNSIQNDPNLNLYTADNSHPSVHGTYLTACTFIATIFRTSPEGLNYTPGGITANEALFLQQMAATTVLDSLDHWNVGVNDVTANFDWDLMNGNAVQFNDLSNQADTYQWNFGDGNTSSSASPIHTFNGAGTFEVQLIVSSACGVDTLSQTVMVGPTGIADESQLLQAQVYPNPAKDFLTVRVSAKNVEPISWEIQDLTGRQMQLGTISSNQNAEEHSIDLSLLPQGTYLLLLTGKAQQSLHRFVKF